MTDTTTTTAAPQHSRLSRLYTGTGAFEIVGRRKRWYIVTAVIVLIALLSMLLRGFSWGIDFEGGTRIQMPAVPGVSVEEVETVFSDTIGFEPEAVQTVAPATERPSRSGRRLSTASRSPSCRPRCSRSSSPPGRTVSRPATRSASPTSARRGEARSPTRRSSRWWSSSSSSASTSRSDTSGTWRSQRSPPCSSTSS